MSTNYISTTNACKLCTPLGAALAFRGIEGAIPFLHGSQGCATYMRRYIISHFREPMDIASSALGEKHAIYGGGPNLKKGILNVMEKYGATLVGVASTCLTETIGDDVARYLDEFRREFSDLDLPDIVHCATPSYMGTHMQGWHTAMRATVEQLVTEKAPATGRVNIMPGLTSAADLRHLKEICRDFGMTPVLLPDISDTMDGQALLDYEKIPSGGTPIAAIKAMSGSAGTIECGRVLAEMKTAGTSLATRFGVPLHRIGSPIGLRETDALFAALEAISGRPTPRQHLAERGRLVDAMVDGHKYIFGKRAIVYGEEDFVIGLTAFLAEIGVRPVLVATGAKGVHLQRHINDVCDTFMPDMPQVREGADFHDIAEEAETLAPDILIGHSKGYRYAEAWNVPLVRVGFPIHDRFGGQRILHLGYRGAQELYDRIVNAVLEKKQADNPVGYGYM
ncbi:MAG: nitrogenase component 1 [Desulfovibrionaceae bacterium]